MRAPDFSPSVEYPAAARRLAMAAALPLAYAYYAGWSVPLRPRASPPAAERPGPETGRHIELYNASDRVRGSGTAAIIDESEKRAVLQEVGSGRVGAAMQRALAAAEKDGTLDAPLYDGLSLRQLREKASESSARTQARSGEEGTAR